MIGKIENVNIRGCEAGTNKKGEPYLIVRFEDEAGKAYELIDKDMDRQPYYKRNTDMNLVVDISMGKYISIRIVDAAVISSGE